MKNIFILGKSGQIGNIFENQIKNENYNLVDNESDADIIALCVDSTTAKPYLDNSDKILLNFTSNKVKKDNVINGIGCSTLSVYKPLLLLERYFHLIEDINVTVLFPQNALSKKSIYKSEQKNIPIYTFNHNHQTEIENLLKLKINMSHFITPAQKNITSSIIIKFKENIFLDKIMVPFYPCFTRDYITWNIISELDNLNEPVEYIINKLKEII